MRRRLFFFLEQLQIPRRERIAVGFLIFCIALFGGLNMILEQKAVYNEEYYEELERIFGERSRLAEAERNEILARYQPPVNQMTDNIGGEDSYIVREDAVINRSDTTGTETGKVNINRAGSVELQSLPGIGPAYAQRIVDWRKENGRFESIDQLLEIRGIGPKRLEAIRPLVMLDNTDETDE